MRFPFQKKPTQISCQLDNGVFSTPGTLTLTKKLLSFEPSSKADLDAGVNAVNIFLKDIKSTSLGMHQRKLTINLKPTIITFAGNGMTELQLMLKTSRPEMRATRIKDKRTSYRLSLGGKYNATLGVARLANTHISAKVLDISTTGCSILTMGRLRVGDYLNVGVTLNGNSDTEVFGRCVRLNKANTTENMVGIQFLSVRHTASKELSDFIMRRQRDGKTATEAA